MSNSSRVKITKADGSIEWRSATGKQLRKPIRASVRDAVVLRDRGLCRYCARKANPIHIDHVIPVTKGGTDEKHNLVVACVACNLKKRANIWEPLTHKQMAIMQAKRRRRDNGIAARSRRQQEAADRRREALYVDNRRELIIPIDDHAFERALAKDS